MFYLIKLASELFSSKAKNNKNIFISELLFNKCLLFYFTPEVK